MHLLRVQAEAMVEHAMLAELLAVIGGDDHERIAEQLAPVELIEELAHSPIEGRDAVVVGIAGQLDVAFAELELVAIPVFDQHGVVAGRFGAEPEMRRRVPAAAGRARAHRDSSGTRRRAARTSLAATASPGMIG